jgi:hypothetical protein
LWTFWENKLREAKALVSENAKPRRLCRQDHPLRAPTRMGG